MVARSRTRLEVLPLTPELFADVARLFEEGGDPKWCWCVHFRFRGSDWTNSTAAQNRAGLEGLTHRPLAPGLLGYQDDRPVGWVSLGPREDYERLAYSKVLAPVDDTPVWSIVCFVVSRAARGRGVAAALLEAAIEFARDHGGTTLGRIPSTRAPVAWQLPTPTTARSRCSNAPGSRSSSAANGTRRARSGRSCVVASDG